jgi:hypothetical protein
MALKQILKGKTTGNLAVATEENKTELQQAAIFAVDREGRIVKDTAGRFLLNPNTYSESLGANWAEQQTPGNSDPVLQWTSGTGRTVNFQALVTAETSDFNSDSGTKPGREEDPLRQSAFFSGTIASAFFKVAKPQPRMPSEKYTNLDISSYLNYYRSLLYPEYDNVTNPKRLRQSPPLVVLYAGSAIPKFPYGEIVNSQQDLWVVTNLSIKITKQTPNLAPMEATVDFTLKQYNIRSFDRRRFHNGE